MKTKITNISPDQNIIEHESGLKTVFVEGLECNKCCYYDLRCAFAPCRFFDRTDELVGGFKPILP